MIRASIGTWINYATTLIFQVLFAEAFGASNSASAFVIAFAMAVAGSSIFITTTLWVIVPRMLTADGAISTRAVRAMAAIVVGVVGLALVLILAAALLPSQIGEVIGPTRDTAQALVFTAAGLLVVLAIAGVMSAVAAARGRRFIPAVAPALPSTAGALWLMADGTPTVTDTLLAVSAGGVIQAVFAGYAALMPRPSFAETRPLRSRNLAAWMIAFLAALSVVPPLQRIIAASADPAGAAHFDYAVRGLQVALQLIIGGLIIATLPEWSILRRKAQVLRAEVTRATALAALLLATGGAFLLVAVAPVVQLVLERGAFSVRDTETVARLVRVMVPGLLAEGLTLVLSQALLAVKLTRPFLMAGLVRVATTIGLTVALGVAFGVVGVALAYSGAMLVSLAATAAIAARAGMFQGARSLLQRTAFAVVVVLLAGAAMMLSATIPLWASVATVFAVALGLGAGLQLAEVLPQPIRQRLQLDRGAA